MISNCLDFFSVYVKQKFTYRLFKRWKTWYHDNAERLSIKMTVV